MQIIELHRVARKVFATCLVCYKMQTFLNLLIGLFADVTLKLMKNCRVYMNTYQMFFFFFFSNNAHVIRKCIG